MKITFLDGETKEYKKGTSALEIAESISPSLAKKAVYAMVDGKEYDLVRPIEKSAKLVLKMKNESFHVINHSCSHLMAAAIKRLYPNVMFGVGPSVEEGFYYDMDLGDVKLNDEDLVTISNEMLKIANENHKFIREDITKHDAIDLFKKDLYKREIIEGLEDGNMSIYRLGDFVDLCRGPHVREAGLLKNFKLLNVSGAYWRGDSKNKQLQRVYGVCFFDKDDLKKHLELLEEREKRDHRKLGRELGLFMISEYGPGFPFFLPKGMIVLNELKKFWMELHEKANYNFIQTPTMLNRDLWEVSGHWKNYRDNMYTSTIDEKIFAIKPMNCPGGMLVYKSSLHSYKDLPLRMAELGHVHRHEASGALSGLMRVRAFTQDDAHIFMTENQLANELKDLLQLFDVIYKTFGLEYSLELSTKPLNKYIGDDKIWEHSEKTLAKICTELKRPFKINEGDGAFYGPKLDFKIKDSMMRYWQCGTIQLDMFLPERFELSYIDESGEKKQPVMLHRTIFGSIERFLGILIEHYAGAFPLWLAPVQVIVIPVNNELHLAKAQELEKRFRDNGIRITVDDREEKMGYKIREAQTKKIPYTIIIGDEEVKNETVSFRLYGTKDTETVKPSALLETLIEKVQKRVQ